MNPTTDKLKKLIRECIEETRERKPSKLQSFGEYVASTFSRGSGSKNFVRYNIQDMDSGIVALRLYFRMMRGMEMLQLMSIWPRVRGEFRMFVDDNMICAEIKFNVGKIPAKF